MYLQSKPNLRLSYAYYKLRNFVGRVPTLNCVLIRLTEWQWLTAKSPVASPLYTDAIVEFRANCAISQRTLLFHVMLLLEHIVLRGRRWTERGRIEMKAALSSLFCLLDNYQDTFI